MTFTFIVYRPQCRIVVSRVSTDDSASCRRVLGENRTASALDVSLFASPAGRTVWPKDK